MAEYGSMVAASGIASLLFLGGWHLGLVPWELSEVLGPFGNVINVLVFMTKCYLLVFVMMWVRWTLPRLRIDQVMMTCLKYLLPISCLLLLGVSFWQVAVPPIATRIVQIAGAVVLVLAAVWLTVRVLRTQQNLPFPGVPENAWTAAAPKQAAVNKTT
jgi:NADH-quinone oxidoreductase subunit H